MASFGCEKKIVAEILKKSGCKKFGLNLVGKKNWVKISYSE